MCLENTCEQFYFCEHLHKCTTLKHDGVTVNELGEIRIQVGAVMVAY